MKDFKNLLDSIHHLSTWTQFISGGSASFSLAIICQIITGQPLIFCFIFALLPCVLSEIIIRKFFPTWVGQVIFWTARRKKDEERQRSIRTILIVLLSVLVLSFIAFTVFCSVYAVPFLQKYTSGISPIWSVFLGIIAVLSTFISLFCFTFEEVYQESERIEKQKPTYHPRPTNEIQTTLFFPKRDAPTKSIRRVRTSNKSKVSTVDTKKDKVRKLKDKAKKQYKRQFDMNTKEETRQNNMSYFQTSKKELIELGFDVVTNDQDKTILITRK